MVAIDGYGFQVRARVQRHPLCQCQVPCQRRYRCLAEGHAGSRWTPWCCGGDPGLDYCDECWVKREEKEPMTADPLNLEAIEARCAGVTPGPWRAEPAGGECAPFFIGPFANEPTAIRSVTVGLRGSIVTYIKPWTTAQDAADATFIANARTDVPALVAEVRRLRRELVYSPLTVDECHTLERLKMAHEEGCRDGLERAAAWHEARAALRDNRAATSTGLDAYGNWLNMANDDRRDAAELRKLEE